MNIHKLAVLTTYNAPWWFMRLYRREPGKIVLMRGFTRLIASGARTHDLAHYDMLHSTAASRQRFLARVDRTFESFWRSMLGVRIRRYKRDFKATNITENSQMRSPDIWRAARKVALLP
jgi:hypothetical protein